MIEAKVIVSPFDPRNFFRSELRKPLLREEVFLKKSNTESFYIYIKDIDIVLPAVSFSFTQPYLKTRVKDEEAHLLNEASTTSALQMSVYSMIILYMKPN